MPNIKNKNILEEKPMKLNKKGQVFDQLGALGIGIAGLVVTY